MYCTSIFDVVIILYLDIFTDTNQLEPKFKKGKFISFETSSC